MAKFWYFEPGIGPKLWQEGEVATPGKTKLVQIRAPRLLKTCDVARMARECVKNGEGSPEEVMACIAKGFGFSHVALKKVNPVKVVPEEPS